VYSPPELFLHIMMRVQFADRPMAHPSFDVWAVGVIVLEMCTGRSLFVRNQRGDNIVEELSEQCRLCAWHTISDAELKQVQCEAAKHFIRWCLKADPAQRPSLDEMLSHPFLGGETVPRPLGMVFHAFMSHCQRDSAGDVGRLHGLYSNLGLHNWRDMKQAKLTLEGMQEGVRQSELFLLFLTTNVLHSWFCQQEILCALEEEQSRGMRIQLLLEVEPRFASFDVTQWEANKNPPSEAELSEALRLAREDLRAASGDLSAMCMRQEDTDLQVRGMLLLQERIRKLQVQISVPEAAAGCRVFNGHVIPAPIVAMVDAHLQNAVVLRRRDFEEEAMMHKLLTQNGVSVPRKARFVVPTGPPLCVFTLFNPSTVGDMFNDLQHEVVVRFGDRIQFTQDVALLPTAERVLVLLSAGVMAVVAAELERVLVTDGQRGSRLQLVFSEAAGWSFGCAEQSLAPPAIKDALNNHEAMAYRDRMEEACGSDHEFPSMVEEFVCRLVIGCP